MVIVSARREAVRLMQGHGISERRACRQLGISASVLRYAPRPDRNVELRQKVVALTQEHRRHGYRMTSLALGYPGSAGQSLTGVSAISPGGSFGSPAAQKAACAK